LLLANFREACKNKMQQIQTMSANIDRIGTCLGKRFSQTTPLYGMYKNLARTKEN
jgi:copper homeostasis protein CutC